MSDTRAVLLGLLIILATLACGVWYATTHDAFERGTEGP